jgi:hypothetical protein
MPDIILRSSFPFYSLTRAVTKRFLLYFNGFLHSTQDSWKTRNISRSVLMLAPSLSTSFLYLHFAEELSIAILTLRN